MLYDKRLQPKYSLENEKRIQLYSTTSVSKEFYDLLWPHIVHFLPDMHFGSSYTVYEFLDSSDMQDLLNEEGIKAAEKCLEHIASAELLPIAIDGKCGGFTYFKSM